MNFQQRKSHIPDTGGSCEALTALSISPALAKSSEQIRQLREIASDKRLSKERASVCVTTNLRSDTPAPATSQPYKLLLSS